MVIDDLTPYAAQLICGVIEHNPAETHAILNGLTRHQLQALAVILAASVDPDKPLGRATEMVPPYIGTVGRIVQTVAIEIGVDPTDIYGTSRERLDVDARHIVCWIAAAFGLSSTQIGKALSRDHSTVLNATTRVTSTPMLMRVASRIHAELQEREVA
jgi:chromosomal replication initiation ATPase DnaA